MPKFKVHAERGLYDLYNTHARGKCRVTRGEHSLKCARVATDLPAAEVATIPLFDELIAANATAAETKKAA